MTNPSGDLANLHQAILWMILTLFSFLIMAMAARELSDTFNPIQIVFMRGSVGLVIVLAVIMQKGVGTIFTQRLGFHVFRNIAQYCAILAWTLSISLIPLALVFALEFTIPIWIAILAVLFLKEKMTIGRFVAVVFGFAGVLIIIRPGWITIDPGSLIVLAASVGFAISTVATKSLARTDTPITILFMMFIIQWPLGAIGSLYVWVTPEWADAPWILLIGVTALSAHYSVTKALALADTTVVYPINFIRMPMIAVIGFYLYDEPFSGWIFLGAFLIFAGNYYNIYKEQKLISG